MHNEPELTAPQRELLGLARAVIEGGMSRKTHASVDETGFHPSLRRRQASFVTLTGEENRLRGCCGSLRPNETLLSDLADNAWRTAFGDPRFAPVTAGELPSLHLEISLLSPLQRLTVRSRAELLAALEPDRHGLLIQAGEQSATFLPKVWFSLPDSESFLTQLQRKAGLAAWPEAFEAWSYTTECFSGPVVG